MKAQKNSNFGFTLVEIMIVVALIGLLATIATPTWVKARTNSQKNTCINNLRQIEGAKQQWALETKQATGARPQYDDISSYLKSAVSCPMAGVDTSFSGSYQLNDIGNPATCVRSPETHLLPPDLAN